MPYDIDASHIENIILELQEEIDYLEQIHSYSWLNTKPEIFERTLSRLTKEKERQYMRLKVHRQKVKDSGIKY